MGIDSRCRDSSLPEHLAVSGWKETRLPLLVLVFMGIDPMPVSSPLLPHICEKGV